MRDYEFKDMNSDIYLSPDDYVQVNSLRIWIGYDVIGRVGCYCC